MPKWNKYGGDKMNENQEKLIILLRELEERNIEKFSLMSKMTTGEWIEAHGEYLIRFTNRMKK